MVGAINGRRLGAIKKIQNQFIKIKYNYPNHLLVILLPSDYPLASFEGYVVITATQR
jgi:hypothetical protein